MCVNSSAVQFGPYNPANYMAGMQANEVWANLSKWFNYFCTKSKVEYLPPPIAFCSDERNEKWIQESETETLVLFVDQPYIQYGYVPGIIVYGMLCTEPRPSLLQLLAPA